jgi:hypothetical protein
MRRYASFFEWYDKGTKELGVVDTLVAALNDAGRLAFHSPREHAPDPPDCVALDPAGNPVAIEVAEVVCEVAARLNAQGHQVFRQWSPGDLPRHIARELADKDAKRYHGGPYAQVVCCLFTDEPALTVAQAVEELTDARFGPFAQLTSAYLLFSYDPTTRSYPYVALRLR